MMGKGKEDLLSFWLPLYPEPQRDTGEGLGRRTTIFREAADKLERA